MADVAGNTGGFWDKLSSAGVSTFSSILAPVSTGLGKSFSNLVGQGQAKVAAATDKIVQSTSARQNASGPAVSPTSSGTKPAPNPALSAGLTSGLILAVLGVILAVYFLTRGSK